MKSVIICEGNTDLTLIQYFLERVYNWEHIEKDAYKNYDTRVIHKINPAKGIKWFKHSNGSILCILAAGGVSQIPLMLKKILDLNKLGTVVQFGRISIISDRDEIDTEQSFIKEMKDIFSNFNISFSTDILHNEWNHIKYTNDKLDENEIEFLPLIIPFEDTGAIETFLLDALCDHSEKNDENKIDKHVIEQCRDFINSIDCKGKYLCHRREITKAKFDTVFVVMTPADAFHQRQSLLRSVQWEDYEKLQISFKQLSKLSEK